MASPLNEKCLLADGNDNPMITTRQANVADPAAITQLTCPAGGTGAAAGGWDTAGNRDLAIVSINAAKTDIALIRTQLVAVLDVLEAHGLMVAS